MSADMGPAASRLVASTLPTELHPFIVHAQPRAGSYLQLMCQHAVLTSGFVGLVALCHGRLVGYAEFRRTRTDEHHLSHICVDRQMRGRGVATRLLDEFILRQHPKRIDLNVFASNSVARSWYSRAGFLEKEKTAWLVDELPTGEPGTVVHVSNLAQALATYDRFGFCEFVGTRAARAFRIGRLGVHCLRFYNARDYHDSGLVGALRSAFPSLKLAFFITPDGAPTPTSKIINNSVRMEKTF